ncbi:hypothetical protein BGZ70_009773 [Mortierella alpina]|uniref:Fork-head domain-containing protein n=1 Tax=Mortierella alpina TaxID=64518 RepID=A0A9P6JCQ0_MORAP|nr:hypothetical protein BGZ70_009773 [Mortierella alpina]
MSTSPSSPSSKSPTSPRVVKRKLSVAELSKPNESWFLILVNAFKSNFEQTLTYRESELYAWIMQAYPYYRHDMHTMQTSVKKTLSSYECFRQNGRSTWTFIPTRALIHLKNLKMEDGRDHSEDSLEENENDNEHGHENENENETEDMDEDEPIDDQRPAEDGARSVYAHQQQFNHADHHIHGTEHHSDGPTDTSIRYVDMKVDLMDEDTPTLSVEEIQRFKQEHSRAHARKAKRKTSGGHSYRPRTKSPPAGFQDECSMSMEAWCNLLVQMFEATPKQKTIREIYAWVHDNYPIYQNAPGDAWQADLTAALESNPLFRAMGRGRWQMATQPSPPVATNGSMAASGNGSTTNPSIKSDDDATDSPSVTEDEDWKAIGSKRLLNFSFRRYSIATDTFPKNHYKVGSTMPAGSSPQPATTAASPSAAPTTASGSTSLAVSSTSGGKLLSVDHRSSGYSTARRFSSYHQPTPKNSPPLSATTFGLPSVEEFSSQLKSALSEETDDEGEEEDPARRYMAPLQSAINSAVLALQTQQSQQRRSQELETPSPAAPSQSHPHSHPHPNPHTHPHSPLIKQETPAPSIVVQDVVLPVDSPSRSRIAFDNSSDPSSLNQPSLIAVPSASSTAESYPILTPIQDQAVSTVIPERKPEPEIVIPSGEDLASDQMDAIQALALLCGGGV